MPHKQKKSIGIPRGLLFEEWHPLYKTFFKELGVEVVVSPKTTVDIKKEGIALAHELDCLSMKIHLGHIKWLIDYGVDYLFVPALSSRYSHMVYCPKIVAIPDILKSFEQRYDDITLPKLIRCYYAVSKRRHTKLRLLYYIFKTGFRFTKNPFKILKALRKARKAQEKHEEEHILTRTNLEKWKQKEFKLQNIADKWEEKDIIRVAIIGHPYIIDDKIASLDIYEKVRRLVADFITSSQIPLEVMEEAMDNYDPELRKLFYFELEQRLVGAMLYFLQRKTVDLIFYPCNFCCGPGSFTKQFIKQISRKQKDVPVIDLSLDVHSEEAIFQTRIESNINLTRSRKRMEREEMLKQKTKQRKSKEQKSVQQLAEISEY
jgi:predicted nucleotide-binding protein (sugar kinase/HSP70/actin superfamily)